jgi:hypothetical protein
MLMRDGIPISALSYPGSGCTSSEKGMMWGRPLLLNTSLICRDHEKDANPKFPDKG